MPSVLYATELGVTCDMQVVRGGEGASDFEHHCTQWQRQRGQSLCLAGSQSNCACCKSRERSEQRGQGRQSSGWWVGATKATGPWSSTRERTGEHTGPQGGCLDSGHDQGSAGGFCEGGKCPGRGAGEGKTGCFQGQCGPTPYEPQSEGCSENQREQAACIGEAKGGYHWTHQQPETGCRTQKKRNTRC